MEILNKNYILQQYLSKLQYIFLVLFVLCIPFQDCGLQGTLLRYFGVNLSNIPLMILIFIACIKFLLGDKIREKNFIIYAGITVYIVAYSLIILLVNIDKTEIAFYMYKVASNTIIFIFWLFAYVYSEKYMNKLGKYIVIANIINITGWVLCDFLKIDLGTMVHYRQGIEYNRFHGFSSETSLFSFMTIILGTISIYHVKSKLLKIIFFVFNIMVTLFGGSKGILISVILGTIIYFLLSKKYMLGLKIIMIICVLVIGLISGYYLLMDAFLIDLEQYTSFATRGSSILSTFYIISEYPFGTGFGIFLPVFKIVIVSAFDFFSSIISGYSLNFAEINEWISDSRGENATIKSIVFQFMAYFGIPFLALFVYYVRYTLKKVLNDEKYLWLFVFIVCGLMTFAGFSYDSIIALAFISYKINIKSNTN
ncbi:hypothetical protein [Megamonas hypermegale]|uniref:hypothetical protein n=1 Tax=Megamonas hypermegale TaxID=158847 RepID=UPI0026F06499|nr:hypothetical protein [Megamonas hypermegale]